MTSVLEKHIGTLTLLDLDIISKASGRDFLPYPFMFTQNSRFATADEASAYAREVLDRFTNGDLRTFYDSLGAYVHCDLRVECHVQHVPADTPSVRLIAYRAAQYGFFAAQQPDADLIDIYTVSPYDLSAAICDDLPLTQPGQHPRMVVPEFAPKSRAEFDTGDFDIHHTLESSGEVTILASEVSAYSTVQSHWRPVRDWGVDGRKRAVVWVRVIDDGDYIYAPDHSHAAPMSKAVLHERIDELIAEDVATIKEIRGD